MQCYSPQREGDRVDGWVTKMWERLLSVSSEVSLNHEYHHSLTLTKPSQWGSRSENTLCCSYNAFCHSICRNCLGLNFDSSFLGQCLKFSGLQHLPYLEYHFQSIKAKMSPYLPAPGLIPWCTCSEKTEDNCMQMKEGPISSGEPPSFWVTAAPSNVRLSDYSWLCHYC